jgi:nucleoid DNA-binding protein
MKFVRVEYDNNRVAGAELTSDAAGKLGTTKTEAGETLDIVISTIISATVAEGECVIPGLGKLKVKATKETSGKAPNGTTWTKPAGKTIKLSLGAEGKALV